MAEIREGLLRTYLWHWAAAASRQCARALSPDADNDAERLFDAFMAVQAIRNCRRAAEALHELSGRHWFPGETLLNFDAEHEDVKTIRNILEHFDAYITGRGRLQKRNDAEPFRVNFDSDSGRLRLSLTGYEEFEVDLKKLQSDIAYTVIDLVVDLDTLEDEPELFDEDQDKDGPDVGEASDEEGAAPSRQ